MLDGGLGELTISSKKVVASPSRLSREPKELVLIINAVIIPGEEMRDGGCDASGEDGLDRSVSAKAASVLRPTVGALAVGDASREGIGATIALGALVAKGELGLDMMEDRGSSSDLEVIVGFGLILMETMRSTMASEGQHEQEEEGSQAVDIVDTSFVKELRGLDDDFGCFEHKKGDFGSLCFQGRMI